MLLLAGCASVQAPLPPSLELPKPPTDLRALRKGNHVYLFWTVPTQTMDRQTVRHAGPTLICRGLEALLSTCGTPIGNVAAAAKVENRKNVPNDKVQASFVDTLPENLQQENATRNATYAVEALNLHSRSAGLSNQVHVPLAPTLAPPANFRAKVTGEGVVLSWDCEQPQNPSPNFRYTERIYRRMGEGGTDVTLADVECTAGHFEDRTIEWQKTYDYRITGVTELLLPPGNGPCPRALSQEGGAPSSECIIATVEGDDSPPQRVLTNDVYPPAVPTGLEAVFSGPGQPPFVDLVWAPNTDADLAGYNVYRREPGGQAVRINKELIKAPAFRDSDVSAGKTYLYAVSAVDARGNESGRSEEASENVPQAP
jgi:stringent starvation protein B